MSRTADMLDSRMRFGASWGRIQPDRWSAIERLDPAGTYLDVGCSTGSYVRKLRAEGRTAWGIDLLCDETWTATTFLQGEATTLPVLPGSVDFTLAFEVLEHVAGPIQCLEELHRVTKRKLVLSVPNCEVPAAMSQSGVTFHHWVDPTHVNFYTERTLSEALDLAGFTVESIRPINAIRPELLLFSTWGLPSRIKNRFVSLLERIPRRTKLYMTLLATASVGTTGGK